MINLLAIIVINGIVVFTLTYFLTSLDGPFDVFRRLREHFGIQYDADGYVSVIEDKFFAKLLSCFWCTATWVSMVVSLVSLVSLYKTWYLWFYVWLASIAIAGLWNRMVTHES